MKRNYFEMASSFPDAGATTHGDAVKFVTPVFSGTAPAEVEMTRLVHQLSVPHVVQQVTKQDVVDFALLILQC